MDNVERAWDMKQILLFHPAGQIFAFICGLFNIITGITKRCFILSLHINCGLLYYFMSALGFIMGIAVYSWAAEKGVKLSMQFHLLSGVCIITLFIAGAASGFMLRRKMPVKQQLRSLHKWVNIVSMALFVIQSMTGILALIPVM
jgi:cytochrome b561